MEFIGITGGVGAGKSEILRYIQENYNAKILLADEVAHELMEPGKDCYERIVKAFPGEDIFAKDGHFDSKKLAEVIFSDDGKRERMNGIVHPAVKEEILGIYDKEKEKGKFTYFILEAALLIEEGYDKICDRLWYIDTGREIRRQRLKMSRGYSDGKIDSIFGSQLSEEEYRKYAALVIDNNGTLEETIYQVRQAFAR
ncbi:MAG: dephospho-CoA kinase [Roseburia sp.]|nr:dephospho-CoA kinase [Roseburia sp.]